MGDYLLMKEREIYLEGEGWRSTTGLLTISPVPLTIANFLLCLTSILSRLKSSGAYSDDASMQSSEDSQPASQHRHHPLVTPWKSLGRSLLAAEHGPSAC